MAAKKKAEGSKGNVMKVTAGKDVDPTTSKVLDALSGGAIKATRSRRAPFSKTFERIGGRWKQDIDDPF